MADDCRGRGEERTLIKVGVDEAGRVGKWKVQFRLLLHLRLALESASFLVSARRIGQRQGALAEKRGKGAC